MNQSKLLDLLLHTATCYGSCGSNLQLSQSCQNMKQMISHVHDCKINECYICKDVNQLIRIHAMNCSLSPCPVLNCNLSRGAFGLHQFCISQSGGGERSEEISPRPSTPPSLSYRGSGGGEMAGSFSFAPHRSLPLSPLKCTRCNCPLTPDHQCHPSRLQPSLSFPSPALSLPMQSKSKVQLSPLLKRSFDSRLEWEGEEDDPEEPGSPYKIEKLHNNDSAFTFCDSDGEGGCGGMGGGGVSINLFPSNEIINLPAALKSPNKSPNKKSRSRGGGGSGGGVGRTLQNRQKNLGKGNYGSHSLQHLWKDQGHLMVTESSNKRKPLSTGHSRSNSWNGFSSSLLSSSSSLKCQSKSTNSSPEQAAKLAMGFQQQQQPQQVQPQEVEKERFLRPSALIENPLFQPRLERCGSFSSEYSEGSSDFPASTDDMEMKESEVKPFVSTQVTGIGMTELELDLSELDLTAVVLDVNENKTDWQSLLIVTPTSRNRPLSQRIHKPIVISELVFEENQIVENRPSALLVENLSPPVNNTANSPSKPLSIFIDKDRTSIIISSPRHHTPKCYTPKNGKQDLIDFLLASESCELFNLVESLDPSSISVDMMEDEDEVFRFLKEELIL